MSKHVARPDLFLRSGLRAHPNDCIWRQISETFWLLAVVKHRKHEHKWGRYTIKINYKDTVYKSALNPTNRIPLRAPCTLSRAEGGSGLSGICAHHEKDHYFQFFKVNKGMHVLFKHGPFMFYSLLPSVTVATVGRKQRWSLGGRAQPATNTNRPYAL